MKVFYCYAGAVAAYLLLANAPAHAQAAAHNTMLFDEYDDMARHSGGGIIDWIQKLSGPRIWRTGGYLGFDLFKSPRLDTGRGVNARVAYLRSVAVDNRGSMTPASAEISVESWQLTLTAPILRIAGRVFELGAGYNYHTFRIEVPDSAPGKFNHSSVPVFAQAPIRISTTPWLLNLGVGVHRFPGFKPTDFRPATPTVDLTDTEIVWFGFFSVEYRF